MWKIVKYAGIEALLLLAMYLVWDYFGDSIAACTLFGVAVGMFLCAAVPLGFSICRKER